MIHALLVRGVIRFGVLQNKTGGKATVVGLSDRQSYTISAWKPNYLDEDPNITRGAWRITGGHLLHDGADAPMQEAWGAIGCIEVCGNNGFSNLNNLIREWAGVTKTGDRAYQEIVNRRLLEVYFDKAVRPPLIPK